MATYTKTLSNNNQYRLELVVNQGSQSISNNTSNVTWALRVRKTSSSNYGGYWASGTFNWSVNIGGVSRSGSINGYDFRNYTLLTLGSGTVTISHNSNGQKSITSTGSWTGASTLGSATASGSMTLSTIPRASTVKTFSNFTIGNNISWAVDRKHSSFTHTVRLVVGGSTIVSATGQGASGTLSINSTAKTNMLNKLSSTSKSVTATLQVETFDGSRKIGSTQSKTATATAATSDITPSASISSISEGANLPTEITGTYVQSKSRLNVRSSASGKYGATISSYRVTVDGVHYNGSNITTNVILKSGSIPITLLVVDSRGVSATTTTSISVATYYAPQITMFRASRNPNAESTNLLVNYGFDIAPLSNKNEKSVIIRYRRTNQNNTTLLNRTDTYENRNATFSSNGVLNANYSYEVEIILRDSFNKGDSIIATAEIGTGWEFINFNKSGKGIAFGKVSEKSEGMEINMDADFLKGITDKNSNEVIGLGGTATSTKLSNTKLKLGKGTLLLEALEDLGIDFPVDWGNNYTKWNSGKLEMWGTEYISPVPNTPTRESVTFPVPIKNLVVTTFTSNVTVTMAVDSSVAGTTVAGYGFTGLTKTGMDVVFTRSNSTGTRVSWHLIANW